MGLDFSHTCPKIDKAISEAKDTIIDYLKDCIVDLCPYLPDEKADEKIGELIYMIKFRTGLKQQEKQMRI